MSRATLWGVGEGQYDVITLRSDLMVARHCLLATFRGKPKPIANWLTTDVDHVPSQICLRI